MAILEVEHLKKTYTTRLGSNRVEALKDVNFTVERGEFVAIMGESGSGKTTLLNLLAALDKPTGGQVRLNGKNLGELKEKEIAGFRRENLGFVFQDFNLLDTFSLRDNIYLPLVLEGKKYEEMSLRAEPIAKKLGITQIHVSQPVELLHGGAQGEREPKTKLLTAVLGFMLLGVGYYLALTSQSSMDALDKFFNAIALVMVGTYCLFSAGSIAFLKILKKNKNYYYQTRHFTSISGMLYRMKQNAVGLANICILSTGVLLVISISTCLWTGIEEVTYTRFPHQISIEANTGVSGIMKTVEPVSQKMIEKVKTGIDQHLEEKQLRKKYESDQRYYVMLAAVDRNKVEKTQSDDAAASTLIKIMEESEYNQVTGEQVELEPGQALVFQAKQKNYGYDTIELGNQMYEVKKWNTNKKSYILDEKTQVYETMTVVTRNHEAKEAYAAVQGKEPEGYSWEYALDLIGDAGEQITVGDEIETILTESSFNGWVEVREKERNTVYSLYGSLLFLGVFVGALFLMGAVMIIYYKQVSEGFDDRKRFQLMQKVGMSRKEIRQTIQSQVVTVFFMPLAVAVVHTMVAFPLTKRIMAMLNFPDSNLFLAATAITIAAFAVVYLIVYVLTARAYYKIVE